MMIVVIRPHGGVRREGKHQLVEVIGQHQQHQQRRGEIEQIHPFGQPELFRFPQRQGYEHRQQRNEQHGQVIQIPEIPDQVRLRTGGDEVKFTGPEHEPEHHQAGDGSQIPADLRLDDTAAKRNAPGGIQADVDTGADKAGKLGDNPGVADKAAHSSNYDKGQNDHADPACFFVHFNHCSGLLQRWEKNLVGCFAANKGISPCIL